MDASVFRHLQVSLPPVLVKANIMVLIRFIETLIRSVKCAGKFMPIPLSWWLTQIGIILYRALSQSVIVGGGAGPVEDGGLEAPKTQVSSKFIPHSLCFTDAN